MLHSAFRRYVTIAFSIILVATAETSFAQGANPRRCLDRAELAAEQMVRHGVFLREAGNRCEALVPGIRELWLDFDQRNGPRLAKQTERRARIFAREFKDDAKKVMTFFDGRLVTYYRHYPLTEPYCRNIETLLKENQRKGWNAFTSQAKLLANEIALDYRACH